MNDNRDKQLIKNTLVLGIGQLVPKFIAIITLPILTKYLSTEQYGVYDLVLSMASLALPVLTLLVQQAAFRYLISEPGKQKEIISSTMLVVISIMCIIAAIVFPISLIAGYDILLVAEIYALYAIEALFDVIGQIVRGKGQNQRYALGIALYSSINMLLLFVLLGIQAIDVYSVLFILIIGYFLATSYLFVKCDIENDISTSCVSRQRIKSLLQYSIPIIPSAVSLWIVNLSNRLIITGMLGAAMNGIFAAANKIPSLLAIAYSVFNLAWTETAVRSFEDNDRDDYYNNMFNTLVSLLIGACLLMVVISPIMFEILIDAKFAEAMYQMPILFLATALNSVVSFLGSIYIAMQKTKQVGISSAVGAVLNLLICTIAIKHIGLFAASIGAAASYAIISVYRVWDLKKYIGFSLNKQMLWHGIGCLTIVFVLYYLKPNIMFWIGLGITVLFNLIHNKTLMRSFTKKILRRF